MIQSLFLLAAASWTTAVGAPMHEATMQPSDHAERAALSESADELVERWKATGLVHEHREIARAFAALGFEAAPTVLKLWVERPPHQPVTEDPQWDMIAGIWTWPTFDRPLLGQVIAGYGQAIVPLLREGLERREIEISSIWLDVLREAEPALVDAVFDMLFEQARTRNEWRVIVDLVMRLPSDMLLTRLDEFVEVVDRIPDFDHVFSGIFSLLDRGGHDATGQRERLDRWLKQDDVKVRSFGALMATFMEPATEWLDELRAIALDPAFSILVRRESATCWLRHTEDDLAKFTFWRQLMDSEHDNHWRQLARWFDPASVPDEEREAYHRLRGATIATNPSPAPRGILDHGVDDWTPQMLESAIERAINPEVVEYSPGWPTGGLAFGYGEEGMSLARHLEAATHAAKLLRGVAMKDVASADYILTRLQDSPGAIRRMLEIETQDGMFMQSRVVDPIPMSERGRAIVRNAMLKAVDERDDSIVFTRITGLTILAAYGGESEEVRQKLRHRARQGAPFDVSGAVQALGYLRPLDAQSLEIIRDALHDPRPGLFRAGLAAAHAAGPLAAELLDDLLRLHDGPKDAWSQRRLVRAMLNIAPDHPAVAAAGQREEHRASLWRHRRWPGGDTANY